MMIPLGIVVSNTYASLGAGWQFGLIALVQTTHLTGDYDLYYIFNFYLILKCYKPKNISYRLTKCAK